MSKPNAWELFGREYRRCYGMSAELALLKLGNKSRVESEVESCVERLSRALDGIDVNIALLGVSHVLEHHLLEPMAGR
jgi:hypothetical protein